ncbi:hypothetical protein QQO_0283, partial [Clostridioides difficile P3]
TSKHYNSSEVVATIGDKKITGEKYRKSNEQWRVKKIRKRMR